MSALILLVEKEVWYLILKKKIYIKNLFKKKYISAKKIKNLEDKIKLINKNDLDYLDMLYREKLRYGTKNEIIIKLK